MRVIAIEPSERREVMRKAPASILTKSTRQLTPQALRVDSQILALEALVPIRLFHRPTRDFLRKQSAKFCHLSLQGDPVQLALLPEIPNNYFGFAQILATKIKRQTFIMHINVECNTGASREM